METSVYITEPIRTPELKTRRNWNDGTNSEEMTFSAGLQIFVQFYYAVYMILMRREEDKKSKIAKGFDNYLWRNKS